MFQYSSRVPDLTTDLDRVQTKVAYNLCVQSHVGSARADAGRMLGPNNNGANCIRRFFTHLSDILTLGLVRCLPLALLSLVRIPQGTRTSI